MWGPRSDRKWPRGAGRGLGVCGRDGGDGEERPGARAEPAEDSSRVTATGVGGAPGPEVTGPEHRPPAAAAAPSTAAPTRRRRDVETPGAPGPTPAHQRRRARDRPRLPQLRGNLDPVCAAHGRPPGPRAAVPLVSARAPRLPEPRPRAAAARAAPAAPARAALSGFRTARRAQPTSQRLPRRRRRRAPRGRSGPGHVGPAGH